jgi:hypothetical protein
VVPLDAAGEKALNKMVASFARSGFLVCCQSSEIVFF